METKPRYESRVIFHLNLRATDVEAFLPKIEVVRRRAARRVALLEPLFPNYLFLRMQLTPETLRAVRWTPGAKRILGNDGHPFEVPDKLVERIRERVEPLGFIRVGLDLGRGNRVRVKNGPFAGLEGIFDRPTTREGRVIVLLQILGTLTPLEIEALDLEQV